MLCRVCRAAFLSCFRPANAGGYQGFWGEEESSATSLAAATSSSVAMRGLLYCNRHPAPHRCVGGGGALPHRMAHAGA